MIASFVADTVPGEGNEKGGDITGRKKKEKKVKEEVEGTTR